MIPTTFSSRSRGQRFRRSLERIAKEHGRLYREAKDVAIHHLKLVSTEKEEAATMPYWCDSCGRECSTYTGDPRMCLMCGGMAEWRAEEELSYEQKLALEMMDEERVEKVGASEGLWISRDDVIASRSNISAMAVITIIQGVRAQTALDEA